MLTVCVSLCRTVDEFNTRAAFPGESLVQPVLDSLFNPAVAGARPNETSVSAPLDVARSG